MAKTLHTTFKNIFDMKVIICYNILQLVSRVIMAHSQAFLTHLNLHDEGDDSDGHQNFR